MPATKLLATPAGRPVTLAPVTPFAVLYAILVMAVFMQTACVVVAAAEVRVMVALLFTVIVPVCVGDPQLPDPVVEAV